MLKTDGSGSRFLKSGSGSAKSPGDGSETLILPDLPLRLEPRPGQRWLGYHQPPVCSNNRIITRWARASFFLACYRYSRVSRPFALFKAKYCKSQRTRYRAAYLPSTSYKYEKLRVEAQVDGNFPIRICPTYGLAVKLCVEGGYTCH